MYEIIEHTKNFSAVLLSELHLNDFEVAFLCKYCKRYNKKLVILARKRMKLPFVNEASTGHADYSEVFCEDLWYI